VAKKKAAKKSAKTSGASRGAKTAPNKQATSRGAPGKKVKKKSAKAAGRELIAPRGDKRYVRRNEQGEFSESDDVGRSLPRDRKTKASRSANTGQGDRGDRRAKKLKS
jgi:hypothetical protein